jgi:hypothetical protein
MPKNNNTNPDQLHTNKVYQVLQLLDKSDCKKLMKFLQSPYFNNSKTLIHLCEIFLELIANGKTEGFEKQFVWKKMFPKEAFDDVNFRKYCSDLLKLTESFLTHSSLDNDESNFNVLLYQTTVKKKLEPLYSSNLRNAKENTEDLVYKSSNQFLRSFEIEKAYYSMNDFDAKITDKKVNIEEISLNLDYFYFIEKLKLIISALSHRKTTYNEYKIDLIIPIISHLHNISIENNPELAAHFYTYQTLSDEENSIYYFKLKKILEDYGGVISPSDSLGLFESALNYCLGKANKGNLQFFQEYFELFVVALEKKIFIIDGSIAQWKFNNIVGISLRLGKLEWAEKFVNEYRNFLPLDVRENTFSFSLSRVYFYQKKYKEILEIQRNIEYEDIQVNLISKVMHVLVYYELDEYDALDSYLESFRVFLSRHKNIPAQRRNSYLNLIKFVRRLTRLAPKDRTAIEKLKNEILAEKETTVNHEWLLEKIEELS